MIIPSVAYNPKNISSPVPMPPAKALVLRRATNQQNARIPMANMAAPTRGISAATGPE
jgi:hypothetical protein